MSPLSSHLHIQSNLSPMEEFRTIIKSWTTEVDKIQVVSLIFCKVSLEFHQTILLQRHQEVSYKNSRRHSLRTESPTCHWVKTLRQTNQNIIGKLIIISFPTVAYRQHISRFGPLVWRTSKERRKTKSHRRDKCNSGDSGIQVELENDENLSENVPSQRSMVSD